MWAVETVERDKECGLWGAKDCGLWGDKECGLWEDKECGLWGDKDCGVWGDKDCGLWGDKEGGWGWYLLVQSQGPGDVALQLTVHLPQQARWKLALS